MKSTLAVCINSCLSVFNCFAVSREKNGSLYDVSGPMGFSRLELSKPVIAAISGFAVAGGLELACWCDLRVMEEDSTIGVYCRRWGVPLVDGGTYRLPKLIGFSLATDLILTGRPVKGPFLCCTLCVFDGHIISRRMCSHWIC